MPPNYGSALALVQEGEPHAAAAIDTDVANPKAFNLAGMSADLRPER